MPKPSLQSIIAYARSGALDYAWRLLCDAGLDRINSDPAVLNVLGRLLKDRALYLQGAERRRLYLEAAAAYTCSYQLHAATYPLINAATLTMLAGKFDEARGLAQQVLAMLQRSAGDAETPYYRAATRAEALLLLDDLVGAKAALQAAIALAPHAYDDHASTLRQFGLILDEVGADRAWLDSCRPPRCLHYAGHMAIASDDADLARRVRDVIAQERIGFGYGALAAGADIVIAEALFEAGVELHFILPTAEDTFRDVSVARYGGNWAERFDRLMLVANEIRTVGSASDRLSPLTLQLAAETAMGSAVMRANILMTEAVQLLILDRAAGAKAPVGSSAWVGAAWERSSRRRHVLVSPRLHDAVKAGVREKSNRRLAAMLRITRPDADPTPLPAELVQRIFDIVANAGSPLVAPRWCGEVLVLVYADPAPAAQVALAVMAAVSGEADICIAGHYGIVDVVADPFGAGGVVLGPATALPGQITRSAPPGVVQVTEDFAAVLHANPASERPKVEFVGTLPKGKPGHTVRLFALTRFD